MTPQEAREKADSANAVKAEKELSAIEQEADEIYETAKSFIKRSSEDGNYDTMLCCGYGEQNKFNHKDMQHAVGIAEARLMAEGFTTSANTNHALKLVNLTIKW